MVTWRTNYNFSAVTPTTNTTYTVTGLTVYVINKTITINVTTTPTVATSITNTTICRGVSVVVNVTGATTYTHGYLQVLEVQVYYHQLQQLFILLLEVTGSCNSAPKNSLQ
jgi:hypothetical protein